MSRYFEKKIESSGTILRAKNVEKSKKRGKQNRQNVRGKKTARVLFFMELNHAASSSRSKSSKYVYFLNVYFNVKKWKAVLAMDDRYFHWQFSKTAYFSDQNIYKTFSTKVPILVLMEEREHS